MKQNLMRCLLAIAAFMIVAIEGKATTKDTIAYSGKASSARTTAVIGDVTIKATQGSRTSSSAVPSLSSNKYLKMLKGNELVVYTADEKILSVKVSYTDNGKSDGRHPVNTDYIKAYRTPYSQTFALRYEVGSFTPSDDALKWTWTAPDGGVDTVVIYNPEDVSKEWFVDSVIIETAVSTEPTTVKAPTITFAFDTVEITSAPGTTVYYTTDGTEPTVDNGTIYTGVFVLETTKTIKAIAVKGGIASKTSSLLCYHVDVPSIYQYGNVALIVTNEDSANAATWYSLGYPQDQSDWQIYTSPFEITSDVEIYAITTVGNALSNLVKKDFTYDVNNNKVVAITNLADIEGVVGTTVSLIGFGSDGKYSLSNSILKVFPASFVADMTEATRNQYFTFSSSESAIASVNKHGIIDLKSPGSVIITVTPKVDGTSYTYVDEEAIGVIVKQVSVPSTTDSLIYSYWDATNSWSATGGIDTAAVVAANAYYGRNIWVRNNSGYVRNQTYFTWDNDTETEPFMIEGAFQNDGGQLASLQSVENEAQTSFGNIRVYIDRLELGSVYSRLIVKNARSGQVVTAISEIAHPETYQGSNAQTWVAPAGAPALTDDSYAGIYDDARITNVYIMNYNADASIRGNDNGSRLRSLMIGYPAYIGRFNCGSGNVTTPGAENTDESARLSTNGTSVRAYYGYATFSSSKYNIDMRGQTSCKAYIATSYSTEDHMIHLKQVNFIPKNTGVLLIGNAYDAYVLYIASKNGATISDSLDMVSGMTNILKPSQTTGGASIVVPVQGTDGAYSYGFSGAKFKLLNAGTTMNTGKAYAVLTEEQYNDVASNGGSGEATYGAKIGFVIDDANSGVATSIVNCPLSIVHSDAPLYNLQGQRVSASYKGIMVKNGRKYINK
jgi:hypothetical protein